jgi:hypothetical protein
VDIVVKPPIHNDEQRMCKIAAAVAHTRKKMCFLSKKRKSMVVGSWPSVPSLGNIVDDITERRTYVKMVHTRQATSSTKAAQIDKARCGEADDVGDMATGISYLIRKMDNVNSSRSGDKKSRSVSKRRWVKITTDRDGSGRGDAQYLVPDWHLEECQLRLDGLVGLLFRDGLQAPQRLTPFGSSGKMRLRTSNALSYSGRPITWLRASSLQLP